MTILETFIKLRDDLKIWVTNNLNQKANISYVDEKFKGISIPNATAEDNGKFLRVVNGFPVWVSISNAEEATF